MEKFSGSCLCKTVRYQIEGDCIAFYHCHCQRCRKFSGTGHASNMRIDSQTIEWLSGENYVKQYKVPEAERFRNDFCSECGSPLPRYFSEAGFIVVPAGTLDHAINIKPDARIFWGSHCNWCCDDDLPKYEEYP